MKLIPQNLLLFFIFLKNAAFCDGLLSTKSIKNKFTSPSNSVVFPSSAFVLHHNGDATNPKSTTRLCAATATSSMSEEKVDKAQENRGKAGNALFLIPYDADTVSSKFGARSPYGSPSILEATQQLERKVQWFSDYLVSAEIIMLPPGRDGDENIDKYNEIRDRALNANALIALHLNKQDCDWLEEQVLETRRQNNQRQDFCHFVLESDASLPSICGPYDDSGDSLLSSPSSLIPWTDVASGKRLDEQMKGLFQRWTSDDFTYALMLFFNRFSNTPIDWCRYSIDATWEKGVVKNTQEFVDMVSKCGDCVAKCVADPQCKECLDVLTELDTTDQVASYRTIVSYESELLKDFSYCILQKNNIFNCDAKIPESPYVPPITEFRGKPLTQEVARSILIGHLDDEDALQEGVASSSSSSSDGGGKMSTSWKVAAGANVAYDQFPSQNQIFYKAASGNGMWYDPVFRVETVDGRNVWCKRHYRVRDGKVPGTFYFSVLDNGVTSNEFWTIVDVADDLSHIIFHYAGAAGAVGQRYLGGLLCTDDGSLPSESKREPLYAKLRSAGIDPWELFVVDNDMNSSRALDAGEPPLDFFRKDVLQQKLKKMNKN